MGLRGSQESSCIYHIFIIWECGNDGELRQTVNLFPFGLGGSNPFTPTKVLLEFKGSLFES